MSPVLFGVVGLVVLLLFTFLGMPIGFALALWGFVGLLVLSGTQGAITLAGLIPYTNISSYTFSVFPLYLLMGDLASSSGIMADAYRAFNTWLGRLPGGLAMATIAGCAGFAAISGSSVANAATMTRISLPEMSKYKYDLKLATGCIAAGGTLGIMIPPSMGFIVYGLITEQSIGKLFMAGILPGVTQAIFYMITIFVLCKLNPRLGPTGATASWKQRLAVSRDAWGVVLIFVLVMGGIWMGIFTPTEAASIGVIIVLILALFRRELSRQSLTASFTNSLRTTGMCLGTMVGAMIFASFITMSGMPVALADLVTTLHVSRLGVLLVIIIIYLILGCLMDTPSMILITVPIFFPVIKALGYDPIWFGVIVTRMAEIGMITPPIGLNVFVMKGMLKDVPMYTIFAGIAPFVITDAFHVALLVAFPQISLFLPGTMMATQ